MPSRTPLSLLPWTTLLRSYVITSVSSIPVLLKPSISVMAFLAHSKSRLLNPDHNRLLHALMKKTFYIQFCAGETEAEARKTIRSLKEIGYKGVILGHAREVVLSKEEANALETKGTDAERETNLRDLHTWRDNLLATIKLTEQGDCAWVKFTGSGKQALQHLKANIACAEDFRLAVWDICRLAEQRGVSLLFDAEQAALQDGIDRWVMYFMSHFNKERAVVYNTYQTYMKRCPKVLAQHLAQAQQEGFVLGAKLVRGAYMGSDPRNLFWDTIAETHKCFDDLAQCLMQQRYDGLLQPLKGKSKDFPKVALVLASHNAASVQKAQKLRDQQAQSGQPRVPLAYATLMGMADHISCELVQQSNTRKTAVAETNVEVPEAMKYLVWGTMGECMKYLLRRARENQDAASRTVDARKALAREIAVRLGLTRA